MLQEKEVKTMYNPHRWGIYDDNDNSSSSSASPPDKPITADFLWKLVIMMICFASIALWLLWQYGNISYARWLKGLICYVALILIITIWPIVLTIRQRQRR